MKECSLCKTPLQNGIHVFQKVWKFDKPMEKPFQSQSFICQRCLVGWNVPVYRSLKQGWEFANVTAFKEETQHHNVRFIDDETAWMRIEPNPFDEYVTFCVNLISSADDGNRNSIGGPNRNGANDISGNNSNDDFDHGGGGGDENWPLQFEDDSVNGNPNTLNFDFPLEMEDNTEKSEKRFMNSQHHHNFSSPVKKKPKLDALSSDDAILELGTEGRSLSKYGLDEGMESLDKLSLTKESFENDIFSPRNGRALLPLWEENANDFSKYCQERPMDVAHDSLSQEDWSPSEDAALFHLKTTKWSNMMSKVMSGRTEESIQERIEYLKRHLEKQTKSKLCSSSSSFMQKIKRLTNELKQHLPDPHGKFENARLTYVALQILKSPCMFTGKRKLALSSAEWGLAETSETCKRCGLLVPSAQGGKLICKTLGWCETCCSVSTCVSGDLLRKIHASVTAGCSAGREAQS